MVSDVTLPCRSQRTGGQTESSHEPAGDFPPSVSPVPGQLAMLLMVNDSPSQPQGGGRGVMAHNQGQNFSICFTQEKIVFFFPLFSPQHVNPRIFPQWMDSILLTDASQKKNLNYLRILGGSQQAVPAEMGPSKALRSGQRSARCLGHLTCPPLESNTK